MADVSVVIATRDRPALLARTLASVRAQVDIDVELIVVDDGSVSPVHAEGAIIVRHQRPAGVAAARNAGIRRASAPYVALLDDDDLWAPTKLAEQLACGGEWVYSGLVVVDEFFQPLSLVPPPNPMTLRERLTRVNVLAGGASCVCARRELLAGVGGFDPSFEQLADWDLWLRLVAVAIPARCDQVHVAYVLHGQSMVLSEPRGPDRELQRLARKHGIEPDRATVARWVAWRQLRAGHRGAAARVYVASGLRDRSPGNLARGMAAVLNITRPHRPTPAPAWLAAGTAV